MKKIKLGNITSKIGSGATPRGGKNTYGKNGVAFIRSQNVRDFYFDYNQLAFINDNQASQLSNDILLNITGDSITRCTLSPEDILPARVSQHVAIVRCHKNINSKFIMYNLQYMKNYLLSICKIGGTRNALTKEMLENLPIDLPPKETQDKIAALLGALDDKIALNKKINATLEAMAKTLYDYWFVQFDFPDENGKPYKSSGGKMIFSSELGRDIPVGWEIKHVADLTVVKTGKEDANFATVNGKFAYFTCGKDIVRCDVPAFEGHAVLLAGNGDFNVKHYTGKFNAYQRTYVLIPDDEKYYALLYIAIKNVINQLIKNSVGSIVKFITIGDVNSITLLAPKNDSLLKMLNILI